MSGKAIQIDIIGHSFDETDTLAKEIKEVVEKVPGAVDVTISREINRPELRIEVNREKAATLGLTMSSIASNLTTYIEGSIATRYREKGETYDIVVRLEESSRSKIEDLENLTIPSPLTGAQIRLSNIAKIYETTGPVDIERQNRERVVRVECNVYKRSTGKVRDDIKARLDTITIPDDIAISFGGVAEEQTKAFRDLTFLLLLGIVLVYMVMAAQFKSLIDPFVIMFSVPMGFPGVILILFLTDTTLSTTSMMGIIMMLGIVVSNGVLLVDYTNVLRRKGRELHDAAVTAARTRLRPILMTSLATVVGLLPMAIGWGIGGETNAPLARVVVGGLSFSTILTVFLVPTIYVMLEERFPRHADKAPQDVNWIPPEPGQAPSGR